MAISLFAAIAYSADFNVRDFGAKGDGQTKDTAAIQQTINACAGKGGGRVVFADGTFLSGALRMKSGVELHIDRTATLLASPDIADFPDWPDAKHVVKENLPRTRNAAFVFADEADTSPSQAAARSTATAGATSRKRRMMAGRDGNTSESTT
ncbi:MAG: hypothetical protein IKJ89_07115 [Kiritimatiellae bacterium]|nr:hypothetical protein [Kiritimatiellia bacterium]